MKRVLVVLLAAAAVAGTSFGVVELSNDTEQTPPRAAETPTPTTKATATRPHPVSLQALMEKRFDGRDLRLGRVLARAAGYTRYFATYRSGDLRISAVVNIPRGRGPFPAVVLNHGYIDPAVYTNGQGLRREQEYLARAGFIVLHTDYRGHAASDDDPTVDLRMRLGYVEDAINAVHALRASRLPVDDERIAMLGRSMGGGVTLAAAVVQPGVVDAFVVYASVSSKYADNFNRWIRARRPVATRILQRYGEPSDNPEFWRNISPRTFFHRLTEPVLMHHGTSDDTCPIRWARETANALRARDKRVALYEYAGEEHAFGPQWTRSMRRTVSFLRANLK